MADSIIKFHDAAERAPVGSWHYFYDPSDGSTMFRKSSADEVIDEVVRYRRNNGQPHVRAVVEEEIWRYYCSRQPERCGQSAAPSNVVPFLPRDQKPEWFGPIIWQHLNLAATRFNQIGAERFFHIVAAVHGLMSCPTCQAHWVRILNDNPPDDIQDARGACKWVHRLHSAVSNELGKAPYTYETGVVEYGFPLP